MKELNEWEKGFVSAFIDTDGGIYLDKRTNTVSNFNCKMVFFNNSKELLDKVQDILGSNKRYQIKYNNKSSYELRYYGKDMRWILPQLELVVKEKKRLAVIEFLNYSIKGSNQFSGIEHKEKHFQIFKLIK